MAKFTQQLQQHTTSLPSPPPSTSQTFSSPPPTSTSTTSTSTSATKPSLEMLQAPYTTPIMLRLSPLCSTPISINYMTSTYEDVLRQIEYEAYSRAPEITEGFIFDGLFVEWDQAQTAAYPCSSRLDKGNFMATIALLRARGGRDVLCVKARVASPGMRLQLK